jgi:hypothetical protein
LKTHAGELIAKAAADQGARPVPAGRNLARVNRSPFVAIGINSL